MFEKLPKKKYDIIYADPPWHFNESMSYVRDGQSGPTTGARTHYPTLKLDELADLPVEDISAYDCLLFLWAPNSQLDIALLLGGCWGFEYKTVAFVWDKQRTNPGNYTMQSTELCLVFKKGRIPQPRGARNVRQYLSEPRTEHSSKPDAIRDRIVEMFPSQKKIELFARSRHTGWDAWGLDVESDG